MELENFVNVFKESAKKILMKDKYLQPILAYIHPPSEDGKDAMTISDIPLQVWESEDNMNQFRETVKKILAEANATAYLTVLEGVGLVIEKEKVQIEGMLPKPSEHPDKKHVIHISAQDKDGVIINVILPFEKSSTDEIAFGKEKLILDHKATGNVQSKFLSLL